jgi:glycosyltransferase involved in cell wall biosynthesis
LYSREAKKKIQVVLEDFQPDVVHLNNFNFQLTPSIFYGITQYKKRHKRHVPIIFTAHDYQWVCPNHMLRIPSDRRVCFACEGGKFINCSRYKCIHNSLIKSVLGSMEGYLYRWLGTYKMTDIIICPSAFMARKLSTNSMLAKKTRILQNFIEAEEDEKETPDKADEEEKIVISPLLPDHISEKRYLIYFGRYSIEKGVETLLQACKSLPDIAFVFAGKGELLEQVQSVENVYHAGFRSGEELRYLVRNARFSIFPSEWYENCPFSVMESLMYGTPVLAAAIGGTIELVEEGKTGEFFQSGNKEELCEKIRSLWRDREKTEQYADHCRNISFTTVSQYGEKIVNIYQSCLSKADATGINQQLF